MRILLIHQNFPGQFVHLAKYFQSLPGQHKVIGIGDNSRLLKNASPHPDLARFGYPTPKGASPRTHHYLKGLEGFTRRGQAVVRLCLELKQKGFLPDVVLVHPAWGEALFLADVFPQARHLHYCEFFYRASGSDMGFDPEFPIEADSIFRTRLRNTAHLISLEYMDGGISPTKWQRLQYPKPYQDKITTIHDGIDTQILQPNESAHFSAAGRSWTADDEVLTYVSRNLEPYRGFHQFMRALPEVLRRRPKAHVFVVGGDEVSYGQPPRTHENWRTALLDEVGDDIDLARVHFLGRIPYPQYCALLQVSRAHVYLSYPFVLSWSMLEAMSSGCLVIGSSTAPVKEVIENQVNGLLFDFFDRAALVEATCEALAAKNSFKPLRLRARESIVERYDLATRCLPQQVRWITGNV